MQKFELPVPGGPKSRIPLQGLRFPVKRCGNLMGRMTASLRASLARSKPATSDHLILGVSITIAPPSLACIFFFSGSSLLSESLSPSLLSLPLSFLEPPELLPKMEIVPINFMMRLHISYKNNDPKNSKNP